jgi:3-hydroxypropanoate dehydrogenase
MLQKQPEAGTMTQTQDTAAHSTKVSDEALDQLFRQARTHNVWLPRRVPLAALREAYELARWGPTSANSSPARFLFLESETAKARLLPALAPSNVEKTKAAPVTAIIAWDAEFHEKLPKLFPHADMRSYFVGKPALIEESAFRNGSLQGAYFILAARSVGLDCGPMSGFDAAKVNAEFFPDGKWKVNFLCNLGYGDHSKLFPRSPRLEFEEACRVL